MKYLAVFRATIALLLDLERTFDLWIAPSLSLSFLELADFKDWWVAC